MTNLLNINEIEASVSIAPKSTRSRSSKKTHRSSSFVRTPRTSIPVNELGVVDQISIAFAKNNLFATLCGFVLGGIVPVTVFRTAHYGVAVNPWLWVLVVGGLIYSAITVFKWGTIAFSSAVKSFGFVVLLEGTLTFSPDHALAYAALAVLTAINGVATGVNLVANRKEARKAGK
jgi:hypothetical protein